MRDLLFTIIWVQPGYEFDSKPRVIGRDVIKRHDLTDAIKRACNMLARPRGGHASNAHGFYVRMHDPETDPAEVTAR